MKKITIYLLLAAMGFLLYSCASSIPRSDAVHQAWAEKHWGNIHLSEARDLYISNCSGCHSLHLPAEHTKDEWSILFAEMAGRAHMTEHDSIAVIAYLETYSKDDRMKIQ
jgi:hypothetical protein